MSPLEQKIESYLGISGNQATTLSEKFISTKMIKGDFFVREDKQCNQLSFIKSGNLRIFKITDQGKEITQWISTDGDLVTELNSFIFDQPSRWNIQALSDVELHSLSKTEYHDLPQLVPIWPELEKRFLAKCFITLEDRVYSFLSMTAEERYNHLFTYKKELFNQIPLNYIASMIGMTPETLSRIRAKSIS
ncbi:MAG: Crp/Fnr family transcriptional regulator [Bacteroidia bacterium]|nr:Crp/Fnr family transcriptional regulator [Bacteroidia bacterium]